ncbi:MAG TPA: sugar phosphate isomerase/epimerase [Fimbriimonadaceae bacterium]|jgi:sugar phosphate isomerase/epimerase
MSDPLHSIKIGTLVPGNNNAADYIKTILPHGFESFQINFWRNVADDIDLKELSSKVKAEIGDDAVIGAIGIYGNPLEDSPEDIQTLKSWEKLIDNAHLFGTDVVAGFTGRIREKPIEDSLPKFKKVFGELTKRAAGKGVKIAFENCSMGGDWKKGDWNIAHSPAHWELMFNEVPAENIGLEWEPCHQMVALIDPIPQIRKWGSRIFHLHGKDATIRWDVIEEHGIIGNVEFAYHRTPGFGDSDWTRIISELRLIGFNGSIDIEGWHDPVYRDELEMTGQVYSLNFLKSCRGGDEFVKNPA